MELKVLRCEANASIDDKVKFYADVSYICVRRTPWWGKRAAIRRWKVSVADYRKFLESGLSYGEYYGTPLVGETWDEFSARGAKARKEAGIE